MLGGYALLDGSGATPLPPATLAPGAFALVVNDAYSDTAAPTPRPAPGTLLLHVPHLGKQGLSNEGEPLSLLDGDGSTVSTFPAAPKPKQGFSVARRTPSAPDALAGVLRARDAEPGAGECLVIAPRCRTPRDTRAAVRTVWPA